MIAQLDIAGSWMWSAWQPDHGLNANCYLFERGTGCVAIDPLVLDGPSVDALQQLGGVHTIVLTNRDHARDAAAMRARFGARILAHELEASGVGLPVDATFAHGDEVFAGAFAIGLPHGKTPGEVGLHLPSAKAAVVGDALIGAPAGTVSLVRDEELTDPVRFLFALRRLWALQLQSLLVTHGQPLFRSADGAIGELLEKRGGAEINRINADEVDFVFRWRHAQYEFDDGEVGLLIGSRKLGYRLAKIPPGRAFCPLHWHVAAEEFFYVLEGRPSIRTLRGTIECRPGDFIAFPTGERGAHQLRNDSAEPCLVLLAGMEEEAVNLEACFYPDSDKVGLFTPSERLRMVRGSPDLDYFDGE